MVLPSGGALLQALASIPMLPPGRGSTITGWWVRSLKALPMAPARMSSRAGRERHDDAKGLRRAFFGGNRCNAWQEKRKRQAYACDNNFHAEHFRDIQSSP